MASTGTPVGPFGFVGAQGYQADSDSGLMLLGHRYYDPSTGRFLTRDSSTNSRNWYVYAEASPTKKTDITGDNPVLIAGVVDPEPITKTILIIAGVAILAYTIVEADNVYQSYRNPNSTQSQSGNSHYPSGPHVDMDPYGVHGGPHIDFPDSEGNNIREPLGPPTWDPVRDPLTGRMSGLGVTPVPGGAPLL